jgi:hypothetical protein
VFGDGDLLAVGDRVDACRFSGWWRRHPAHRRSRGVTRLARRTCRRTSATTARCNECQNEDGQSAGQETIYH